MPDYMSADELSGDMQLKDRRTGAYGQRKY